MHHFGHYLFGAHILTIVKLDLILTELKLEYVIRQSKSSSLKIHHQIQSNTWVYLEHVVSVIIIVSQFTLVN